MNIFNYLWYINKFKFIEQYNHTSNNSDKLILLIKCGIGDLYSYMARWNNLLRKYPDREFVIYAGSNDNILKLMPEILKNDKRVKRFVTIKGFRSQAPKKFNVVLSYIKRSSSKNDIIMNWIPDESSLSFDMDIPFKLKFPDKITRNVAQFLNKYKLKTKKYIIIHPITQSGGDYRDERNWSNENYQKLIDLLIKLNYKIIMIGLTGEEAGIVPDNNNIFNFMNRPIEETISIISNSMAFIGTNTFTWEVASYQLIPTICFFFTNRHWLPIHIPKDMNLIPKTIIISNKQTSAEKVFDIFMKIIT